MYVLYAVLVVGCEQCVTGLLLGAFSPFGMCLRACLIAVFLFRCCRPLCPWPPQSYKKSTIAIAAVASGLVLAFAWRKYGRQVSLAWWWWSCSSRVSGAGDVLW